MSEIRNSLSLLQARASPKEIAEEGESTEHGQIEYRQTEQKEAQDMGEPVTRSDMMAVMATGRAEEAENKLLRKTIMYEGEANNMNGYNNGCFGMEGLAIGALLGGGLWGNNRHGGGDCCNDCGTQHVMQGQETLLANQNTDTVTLLREASDDAKANLTTTFGVQSALSADIHRGEIAAQQGIAAAMLETSRSEGRVLKDIGDKALCAANARLDDALRAAQCCCENKILTIESTNDVKTEMLKGELRTVERFNEAACRSKDDKIEALRFQYSELFAKHNNLEQTVDISKVFCKGLDRLGDRIIDALTPVAA